MNYEYYEKLKIMGYTLKMGIRLHIKKRSEMGGRWAYHSGKALTTTENR